MKRTTAITLCLVMFSVAEGAQAGTLTDAIEQQLRAQGFDHVAVSTTWLGRTRIDAVSPTQTREIVINPRTGEILRDYWADTTGAGKAPKDTIVNSRSASDETEASGGISDTGGDGPSSAGAGSTDGSDAEGSDHSGGSGGSGGHSGEGGSSDGGSESGGN